jgi:hypothetical protein
MKTNSISCTVSTMAVLLLIVLFSGCSKDEAEEVSGTIEFSNAGSHEFEIDAANIKATITIVGAGGGGGGGVDYNAGGHSTGGGGGGGAGAVQVYENVDLQRNVQYNVSVGQGGAGGQRGNPGGNGLLSSISLEQVVLYTSAAGSGGKSNAVNDKAGGDGGAGFPAGSVGGNGEELDAEWSAPAGTGGEGGDNLSTFGLGGIGGRGTKVDFLAPLNAQPGLNGANGYVKIDWTGER